MGLLKDWGLEYEEIDELITENPSLRGMLLGYAAESKLRRSWFDDPRIEGLTKYDDHDRHKKGDMAFSYAEADLKVEVKSLQTNSVVQVEEGKWRGKFQCDASDRRPVTFPDGTSVETTCLLVGEFDLLAVNLLGFHGDWIYAFAKNSDLPRTKSKKFPEAYRHLLLRTLMPIAWPLEPPYRDEPFGLLDELAEEKRMGTAPNLDAMGIEVDGEA